MDSFNVVLNFNIFSRRLHCNPFLALMFLEFFLVSLLPFPQLTKTNSVGNVHVWEMDSFRIFAAFLDKALVRILYVVQHFLKFLKLCKASTEKWLSRAGN